MQEGQHRRQHPLHQGPQVGHVPLQLQGTVAHAAPESTGQEPQWILRAGRHPFPPANGGDNRLPNILEGHLPAGRP